MGTLVAMHYPTKLFANQADHTYVKCGTGGKAWSCWGGKSGGRKLRDGQGSTKRADCIAKPDEKAGIKCYLINGVCHQAANRILLPAGITVRGARGYSISEAMFGTYGRVGYWPCKSPFDQCKNVAGDLPACRDALTRKRMAVTALSEAQKLDWQYVRGVLGIYDEAKSTMRVRSLSTADTKSFHMKLFMYMAEFHLGPLLDRNLDKKLRHVRGDTEKKRLAMERSYAREGMSPREFVEEFDKATIAFQHEMATALTAGQYQTLFDMKPGDTVVLADQKIVKKIFPSAG